MSEVLPQAQVVNQTIVAHSEQPRVRRRSKRSAVSATAIVSYVGVFFLIVSLVAISYHPPERKVALATAGQLASTAAATTDSAGVDQLLATTIGANLADTTGLPIANNVANLSQSLTAESALAQTDTNTASKPQNVGLGENTTAVRQYTAVAGDTVPTVAAKYNLTAQTIRWVNNLTSDALEPGKVLTIPPKDGIMYTVKQGDTVETIATKYKADANIIRHDNDLENAAPAVGAQLLIADGVLPANEQPGYVAPRTTTSTGSYGGANTGVPSNIAVSAGNRYAWGNCTWYAYERRAQLGNPVGSFWGNASTWGYNARLAGYSVDGNPSAGAVMVNGGGYGHVAIVESVNPGVSVHISEMNAYRWGGGFNRVDTGDIPWSEAVSGYYQYVH